MNVIGFGLTFAALVAAAPCRADPPLAGESRFTVSHGQPFCTSRAALQALLRAQVSRAPYGAAFANDCQYVPDNAIVAIGEDLSPRRRYMHVVRARANTFFGTIDGYTYSVGLYPYPVRQPPFEFRVY